MRFLAGEQLVAAAAGHLVEGGRAFGLEDGNDLAEGELGHLDSFEGYPHLAAQYVERGRRVLEVIGVPVVVLLLLGDRGLGVGCVRGERL
jgi:hypothetical protein